MAGKSGQRTALVAEGDDVMRSTIELWLADADWTVLTAADGREAMDLVSEEVDVLLCDWETPELTASKIFDHLRERNLDVSVVIVGTYESDEDVDRDEADAYLTKPLRKNVLITVLSRVSRKPR